MDIKFAFSFGQRVKLNDTETQGRVSGVCQHANNKTPEYRIRYLNKDGEECFVWIEEADLAAVE